MRIVEYRVVDEAQIQSRITEGYQPYGNPMLHQQTTGVFQAMVKYEKYEETPDHPDDCRYDSNSQQWINKKTGEYHNHAI